MNGITEACEKDCKQIDVWSLEIKTHWSTCNTKHCIWVQIIKNDIFNNWHVNKFIPYLVSLNECAPYDFKWAAMKKASMCRTFFFKQKNWRKTAFIKPLTPCLLIISLINSTQTARLPGDHAKSTRVFIMDNDSEWDKSEAKGGEILSTR